MNRPPAFNGTLPLGSPLSLIVDHFVTSAPTRLRKGDGAANCAAASGPESSGVCELPDAAAPLSAADRTRMVEAIERVIAHRHKQLDHGHSLDRDLAGEESERRLLGLAIREANYTRENVTLRVGGADWMNGAIERAAKSAALMLAAIELMLERKAQHDLEPPAAPIEQGKLDL